MCQGRLRSEVHGTAACYQHGGCRCDECKEAQRAYAKEVRARRSPEDVEKARLRQKENHKKWRENNPDTYKEEYRRRNAARRGKKDFLSSRYGITLADYEAMQRAQDGRCAICHQVPDKALRVDHDHADGRVRGLLCHNCNAGLGMLGDSKENLLSAFRYQEGHDLGLWGHPS